MAIRTLQLAVVFVFATFITVGCIIIVPDSFGTSVRGSGNLITEERDVSSFNEVQLKGSGKVTLTQGDKQSLKIQTDDNIMPLIETRVINKKLTISHGKYNLRPTTFNVDITVEKLEGVSIAGSGDISGNSRFFSDNFYAEISGSGDIELELEVSKMKAAISGSGSINLFGKADDSTAAISGSGKINAFDFETKNVSVTIRGSGDCRVNASESLHATISGSGDIYYKGRPQISTRISGSGSLKSQD